MKERSLLQISLLTSVAGLIILFFVSRTIGMDRTDIGKIAPENVGKNVKICGEITSKSISKAQHVFLEVRDDSGTIDVTVFNTSSAKNSASKLEKNQSVCITGNVDEYRNKLQIVLGNGKIESG